MASAGIQIEVLGTPAPKGSARAFYKAGMKRAVIVKDNSEKQKSWDSAVRQAARDQLELLLGPLTSPPFVDVAIAVELVFRMGRPSGHWATGKNAGKLKAAAPVYPRSKPDIDKLARTTLDALTGTLFDDDGRIARLHVTKQYAMPGREGALIIVHELDTSVAGLDELVEAP